MRMPGAHDRMSASDARKRNANLMETSLRGRDRLALGFRETTDLAPAFLRTPQVSVERVVEESSAGHDIWIIAPDLGEPLADRPQEHITPAARTLLELLGDCSPVGSLVQRDLGDGVSVFERRKHADGMESRVCRDGLGHRGGEREPGLGHGFALTPGVSEILALGDVLG